MSAAALQGEIVDAAAIHIGELYQKAKASIVDSVKYQIECGTLLAEKKSSLPHGAWLQWLEANSGTLGFESRFTAAKLMRLANGPLLFWSSMSFVLAHYLITPLS